MSGIFMPASGVESTPKDNYFAKKSSKALSDVIEKKQKQKMLLGVFMVVTSLILAFVLFKSSNHEVSVLVASQDLPAGATLNSQAVVPKLVSVGATSGVILSTELKNLENSELLVSVKKGELLTQSEFSQASKMNNNYSEVGLSLKQNQIPSEGLEFGDVISLVYSPNNFEGLGSLSAFMQSELNGSNASPTFNDLVVASDVKVVAVSISNPNSSSNYSESLSVAVPKNSAAEVSILASNGEICVIKDSVKNDN